MRFKRSTSSSIQEWSAQSHGRQTEGWMRVGKQKNWFALSQIGNAIHLHPHAPPTPLKRTVACINRYSLHFVQHATIGLHVYSGRLAQKRRARLQVNISKGRWRQRCAHNIFKAMCAARSTHGLPVGLAQKAALRTRPFQTLEGKLDHENA